MDAVRKFCCADEREDSGFEGERFFEGDDKIGDAILEDKLFAVYE